MTPSEPTPPSDESPKPPPETDRPAEPRPASSTTIPPVPELRTRAIRGGSFFLVAKLVIQGFQWSVTLLVARLLDSSDYGLMTIGTLFTGVADLLADAGISKALVQKKEIDDEDLAECLTLSALIAGGLYVALFVAAPFLAEWQEKPGFALFLRVLALLLLLTPIRSVSTSLMERGLHLGRQSLVYLGAAVLQSFTVLALAWYGFGYWALAAGALLGAFIQTLILYLASGWRMRFAWPSRRSGELLRFGIPLSAGSLLWKVYSNSDFAVIAALFDARTLGFYSLSFELMSLPVQKFSVSINQVMFSLFARHQDEPERLRDWYLRLTSLLTMFAAPVMVGLGLIASDGMPLLLGEQWRPAVLPFQILCPVGVLMIISTSLIQFLAVKGRTDFNLRYNIVCVLAYPVSFWLMGEWLGLLGVCLVWPIVFPCVFAYLVQSSRHVSGISLMDLLIAQRVVILGTALMTAAVLAVQWMLADAEQAWVRLTASIATGAVVYAAFILATGRPTLVSDLFKILREIRGRRSTKDQAETGEPGA